MEVKHLFLGLVLVAVLAGASFAASIKYDLVLQAWNTTSLNRTDITLFDVNSTNASIFMVLDRFNYYGGDVYSLMPRKSVSFMVGQVKYKIKAVRSSPGNSPGVKWSELQITETMPSGMFVLGLNQTQKKGGIAVRLKNVTENDSLVSCVLDVLDKKGLFLTETAIQQGFVRGIRIGSKQYTIHAYDMNPGPGQKWARFVIK
jgi:hypothetical protein